MTETYKLRRENEAPRGNHVQRGIQVSSAGLADAYRGFIMMMLAASGFGIYRFASLPEDAPVWQTWDHGFWRRWRFTEHPAWVFGLMGVSFWDLIQPAFMFMVGVAMPFSYMRRQAPVRAG
ncbi:MAG: hypothetical protein R3C02_05740 [Planctomycetaceae bacterium]